MGKKGPLWWRESDWLLRGSSAANQILLRHSGPILSGGHIKFQSSIGFGGDSGQKVDHGPLEAPVVVVPSLKFDKLCSN